MIQRIQGRSVTGMQSKAANKAARKLEEAYVSASSNLAGTVNEKKAARQLRDAELFNDKNTLIKSIASLTVSKKNIPASAIKSSKEAPMPTPAEIAKKQGITDNNGQGAFNFFG